MWTKCGKIVNMTCEMCKCESFQAAVAGGKEDQRSDPLPMDLGYQEIEKGLVFLSTSGMSGGPPPSPSPPPPPLPSSS